MTAGTRQKPEEGRWGGMTPVCRNFLDSPVSPHRLFPPSRPRTKIPSKVGKDEGDDDTAGRPSRGKDMGGSRPKWTASVVAGAGGGLVASVATCPLDVVKTKLQAQRAIQGETGYLGIWGTVRSVIVHDGLRGLYRGLGPTILGYLPTWAIYFSVYDFIKSSFGEAPLGISDQASNLKSDQIYPAAQVKGYQPVIREHPWSLHLLSAMTAGAVSTTATNPLWVIKTRFMTQSRTEVRYRHTLDAAVTIYRTEGISAFYRGLFPSLLGILHVAVQFPLYERLKMLIARDTGKPLAPREILICSAVSKMTASIATYPHEVIRTRLQTQRRPLADDVSSDGMVKRYPSAERVGNLYSNEARFVEDPRRVRRGGVVYTVRKLVVKEGWTGLYRGLSVNLLRTVPNSAVTMLTYEMLMRHMNRRGVLGQ